MPILTVEPVNYNMVLRADQSVIASDTPSANAAFPMYWSQATFEPRNEWTKCTDVFQVKTSAKYSVSNLELKRDASTDPQVKKLLSR